MATSAVDPVRPELRTLHPYVPGKPVEVLERELRQLKNAVGLG